VETNTIGDNIYRYKVTTTNCIATQALPTYFKYLNENPQVFITGEDILGYGKGKVNDELTEVSIQVSQDGIYNVLVIGTRKDQLMKDYWDEYKDEIPSA
jgi:hypothetical protein